TADRLTLAEEAANLTLHGALPSAENGQTVSVVLNGHTYTGTVTGNAWSVTVLPTDLTHTALPDSTYTVTANVSDLAGNPAPQATHSLTVDETAPTIAIGTISTDDRLSLAESTATLALTGTPTALANRQTG